MATDRNDRNPQLDHDTSKKRDRTIGEGMDSLDSTQAPLKAETGEPDWDAMKGRVHESDKNKDEDDNRSSNR